ncbi:MAG: hypothetical protein JRL30_27635 [Deltaproteobacteria bacterium]|nr:hypothetical protein [Deltaproteobacteria bacterium]
MTDDQAVQQGIANMKACGNNILEMEEGAVVDEEKLDNSVLQKIKVSHIGATRFLRAPNILGDTINMHGMLQEDSNRISGVESVAEGRPAGSLTSGVALEILLSGTNRKVQPRNRMFADFKQEQGKQVVDIMKDVYRAGRVLRVSDEDGLPVNLGFDLSAVTDTVDVRVDSNSEFAVNPTKVLPFLIQLAQIPDIDGLPMVDSKIILDTAEFPGKNEMMERKKEMFELKQKELAREQEGRNAPQTNRPQAGSESGGSGITGIV